MAGNVRAEMARRGISQRALGERLGIKQQLVSNRLRGLTPFTVGELTEIADLLDLPISTFFAEQAAS